MTRIVTTHYRYKRPPRKRAKPAAIEAPGIVTAPGKRGEVSSRADTSAQANAAPAAPAHDDRQLAIVTARKPRAAREDSAPDLTPEELQQRADAAAALWRELVRRVGEG